MAMVGNRSLNEFWVARPKGTEVTSTPLLDLSFFYHRSAQFGGGGLLHLSVSIFASGLFLLLRLPLSALSLSSINFFDLCCTTSSRRTSQPTTQRTVLIMDEVDGMSGGDRGGMRELISMIKKTQVNRLLSHRFPLNWFVPDPNHLCVQ